MDIFNKKRIAELEAEVLKYVDIQVNQAHLMSDYRKDARRFRVEIEGLENSIKMIHADRANEEKEAEQLEQTKIAEQQLAEIKKVVKVGQTFKKLDVDHIVTRIYIGHEGLALVACDHMTFNVSGKTAFYYDDLDLLKALAKKK